MVRLIFCFLVVMAVFVAVSGSFGSVITLTDDDIIFAAEIFSGSYGEEGRHFGVSDAVPYFIRFVSEVEQHVLNGDPYLFDSAVAIFDEEFGGVVSELGTPLVPYSHHAMHVLWFVWTHRVNNVASSVAIEVHGTADIDEGFSVFDEMLVTFTILKNLHVRFLSVDFYRADGLALILKPRLLDTRLGFSSGVFDMIGTLGYTDRLVTQSHPPFSVNGSTISECSSDTYHPIGQSIVLGCPADGSFSVTNTPSHRISDSHDAEEVAVLSDHLQALAILSFFLVIICFSSSLFFFGYATYMSSHH